MNDALIVSLLSVVPKKPTARLMGWSTRLALPRILHRVVVSWYVRAYRVDLSECEGTIDDYPTLARFFTRALKDGVRPIDDGPDALTSPVDARVHSFGTIVDGRFEQAPGLPCRIDQLAGEDAARWEGGGFAVLYLSPQDYHRVHTPAACTVSEWRYHPGRLWPVFAAATRKVDGLFDRNERLNFHLQTEAGEIVLAMIGAFGVGRMTSPHADVTTNTGGDARSGKADIDLARGAELGQFEMGSTVILLTEPGRVRWELVVGEPVRLGRPIGRVLPRP